MPKPTGHAKPKKPTNTNARTTWRRFVVNALEDSVIREGYAAVAAYKEIDGRPYRLMTYLRDAVLRAARADAEKRNAA